jgi:hypothetical protein
MITKAQRQAEFRKDLEDLLKRHNAEMDITDDGKSYKLHLGVCRISMKSVYENNELAKEYCEFNV